MIAGEGYTNCYENEIESNKSTTTGLPEITLKPVI